MRGDDPRLLHSLPCCVISMIANRPLCLLCCPVSLRERKQMTRSRLNPTTKGKKTMGKAVDTTRDARPEFISQFMREMDASREVTECL